MNNLAKLVGISFLFLGATSGVNAATLNITATADNEFNVYLATAAQFGSNTLGTQIGGSPAGNNWQVSYNLPATNLPNSTPLYLQIVLTNWTPTNGFSQYPYSATSNPSAFIGDLSISGGGYVFGNGSSTISSNPTNWSGSTTSDPGTWTATGAGVVSYGTNDGTPNIWTTANGGPIGGISSAAQWIFFGDQSTALYSDLSLEIVSNQAPTITPLPATLPLFASGLGALGLLRWRRNRKVQLVA